MNSRSKPDLNSKLYSPEPRNCSEFRSAAVSDFIQKLQEQIHRLSPLFTFKLNSASPFAQSISCLSQVIDEILNEKPFDNNVEETTKNPTLIKSSIYKSNTQVKDDLEKVKETTKNLQKYEILLKKKAEKISIERLEIFELKKKLQDQEEYLKNARLKLESDQKNFQEHQKREAEDLNHKKKKVEQRIFEINELEEKSNRKVQENMRSIQIEKESLESLEKLLSQTKETLLSEQKKITLEKIEIEKIKLDLEKAAKDIEDFAFNLRRESIELQNEKRQIDQEKTALLIIKEDIEKETAELETKKLDLVTLIAYQKNLQKVNREIEEKTIEFSADLGSDIIRAQDSIDRENNYQKFQYQIEVPKELEERQSYLEEKEDELIRVEVEIKDKLNNIQKIEQSLNESAIQIDELKLVTIPDLENQSNLLEDLISQIKDKKIELEISIAKLTDEIEYVKKYKKRLDSESSAREKYLNSLPECNNEKIREILEELEGKIQHIIGREEELEEEQQKVEIDKRNNIETAEFLKKAHIELEISRNLLMQEIQQEKLVLKQREELLERQLKQIEKDRLL